MVSIVDNGTGKFTGKMTGKTLDLVVGKNDLGEYLKAKVGNLVGVNRNKVNGETTINIPSNYNNDEGNIGAMAKLAGYVKGLRIDLQKAQTHNNNKYATFQVQWGSKSDGKKGGAYAGALMRVDTNFTVANLREALWKSNETQTYWLIDP